MPGAAAFLFVLDLRNTNLTLNYIQFYGEIIYQSYTRIAMGITGMLAYNAAGRM